MKIVLIILATVLVYGIICPYLISYNDNILVITGIVIGIGYAVALFYIKKKLKENKE